MRLWIYEEIEWELNAAETNIFRNEKKSLGSKTKLLDWKQIIEILCIKLVWFI